MKKGTFIIVFLFLFVFLSAQELQHDAIAINIEVPVRVFTKGKFVEVLGLKDFEVYENGVLQKIEAVYLIKKTKIEREESELEVEESKQRITPQPSSRHFVFVFEVIDYSTRLGEVIDYFFKNVFAPKDKLIIVTPLKTYNLKNEFFTKKPLEKVCNELKKKLKKDIRIGNAEYKSIMRKIMRGDATPEDYLRLKNLRYFEEQKLMDFVEYLKNIEGQKNVFVLYQRDAIPASKTSITNVSPTDLFSSEDLGKDITFNADRVKQAFSDSLISAYFIYIVNTENYGYGIESLRPSFMIAKDWSMNIFSAFYEVAKATGGLVDSTANPAFSFKKAAEASENYYLLYYSPKAYKADGKFRKIKVKVKGKNYRVTHRAGYIAD